MNRLMLYILGIGVMLMSGCISIEEQLASSDPKVRAQGLNRACDAAIGDLWLSKEQRLAWLSRLDSDEALCKVIIGISSQRQKNVLKGLSGKPFCAGSSDSVYQEDNHRVEANVAIIKAAVERLKNPTFKQIYNILIVAKQWPKKDNDISAIAELPQIIENLAMKVSEKENMLRLLKDSSGDSRSKIWISDSARSRLYVKYISKEEDQSILTQIVQNGYVEGAYISRYSFAESKWGKSNDFHQINRETAIKKISDIEILVNLALKNEKMACSRLLELRNQKALSELFVKENVSAFFDDKDIIKKADGMLKDVTMEKANALIKIFTNQSDIASLAVGAQSFNLRSLAIEKVEDQNVLANIVTQIKNCPRDTEQKEKNLFDNVYDWLEKVEELSAIKLQEKAIKRITVPTILKDLRKKIKKDSVVKMVSARMLELGVSNVDEIVSAKSYSKDLLAMLAEVHDKKELKQIADKATLRGIKILAKSKIGENEAIAEAREQVAKIRASAPNGKFSLGGFYLGMSVEDAFAILWSKYSQMKPYLYINGRDGQFINIGLNSDYKCDFSWGEVSNMQIYRITFTPDLVRELIAFKNGTYKDMKKMFEDKMKIVMEYDVLEQRYKWSTFLGPEMLNRRVVSQEVGSLATVEGETIRFFEGERRVESIDIMQWAQICGWDLNQLEKEGKSIDMLIKDVNHVLAYQGSIRLERTQNATKGVLGATGSLGAKINLPLNDDMKNVMKSASDLIKVESQLNEVKAEFEKLLNVK